MQTGITSYLIREFLKSSKPIPFILFFNECEKYLYKMIDLNVIKLNKRFGSKPVLTDVSFSSSSTVLGISGSNGSGKSTLLKCISGLMKPSSGEVRWVKNGSGLSKRSLKNHIGYAAPYIQYYEELSVMENLQFLMDLNDQKDLHPPHLLLKRFGIGPLSENLYGELSTGQQQRVKLAGALIHQPEILILDEPGSNLDKKGRFAVEELIIAEREQNHFIILASNQSYELDLCDKTIHLTSQ